MSDYDELHCVGCKQPGSSVRVRNPSDASVAYKSGERLHSPIAGPAVLCDACAQMLRFAGWWEKR
jgi:hypothetical protein